MLSPGGQVVRPVPTGFSLCQKITSKKLKKKFQINFQQISKTCPHLNSERDRLQNPNRLQLNTQHFDYLPFGGSDLHLCAKAY